MMDVLLNDNLQGKTIKRYLLELNLGCGVLGDAYKSIHPDLQRYVVVKILHPYYCQPPRFRRYFERDMFRALSLTHPNIIPIIDFGIADEGYYLVTPFINGLSLVEYQGQLTAPLSPIKTFHLLAPIAAGLQFIHAQGMIHGQLKPENVLIDDQENSFLADWAVGQIARFPDNGLMDVRENALAFMAPERVYRSSADTAVDIYALGAVMYKMLTGQRPCPGTDPGGLVPPTQFNPHLPALIEKVILQALAPEPENRFENPDAMMIAFRRALSQTEDQQVHVQFPSDLDAFVSIQIPGYKIQPTMSKEALSDVQAVTQPIYQRYLAFDTDEYQSVSLTVLRMTTNSHSDLVARFFERLQVVASVSHPGLTCLTRSGYTQDKRPFAAFVDVPGATWAEMLPLWTNRAHAISVLAALHLVRQVASALEVAHWADLYHQELTPDQIIIQSPENLPVIRGLEIPTPPSLDLASASPQEPGYVPPEQYSGEPITAQTNIYTLGVMLFELLSGYRPHLPLWQVAKFGLTDIPKPTPLLGDTEVFTPDTDLLVARCLTSNVEERFPNISAFMVQLDKAIASEAENVGRPPQPPELEETVSSNWSSPSATDESGKRNYWSYLAVGGFVLLFVILAIFWWQSSRSVDELIPPPSALAAYWARPSSLSTDLHIVTDAPTAVAVAVDPPSFKTTGAKGLGQGSYRGWSAPGDGLPNVTAVQPANRRRNTS